MVFRAYRETHFFFAILRCTTKNLSGNTFRHLDGNFLREGEERNDGMPPPPCFLNLDRKNYVLWPQKNLVALKYVETTGAYYEGLYFFLRKTYPTLVQKTGIWQILMECQFDKPG